MSGYVKTGRGGAGNMIPEEELRKRGEDVEAQESNNAANEIAVEEVMSPPPGEYKHMGRGGAGNWYEPSELAAQGVTEIDTPASNAAPGPTGDQAKPAFRGRGGAGNFTLQGESVETQAAERREELEQARKIEEAVDKGLTKPSQAHIKDGEKTWDNAGWSEAGL